MNRAMMLCLAALLASSACKRGSTSSAPTESTDSLESETDANVKAALAMEGCSVTRVEGRDMTAKCGDAGDESSLFLTNLDLAVKDVASPLDRAKMAQSFVHRLTRTTKLPDAAPLGDLRLAVKSQKNYIEGLKQLPGSADTKLVSWPIAGDLVAVAVIDLPENIVTLTESQMEKWKLTRDAVYAKALENFDAHPLEPKRLEVPDVKIFMFEDLNDAYESARILSPKARASLEKALGGKAVFAAPEREHLLAVRKDDANSIAGLRALAEDHARGAYGIVPDLFEVDDAGKLRVFR